MGEEERKKILEKISNGEPLSSADKDSIHNLMKEFACGNLDDMGSGGIYLISRLSSEGLLSEENIQLLIQGQSNLGAQESDLDVRLSFFMSNACDVFLHDEELAKDVAEKIKAGDTYLFNGIAKYSSHYSALSILENFSDEEKLTLCQRLTDNGFKEKYNTKESIDQVLSSVNLGADVYQNKKEVLEQLPDVLSSEKIRAVLGNPDCDVSEYLAENWSDVNDEQKQVIAQELVNAYCCAFSASDAPEVVIDSEYDGAGCFSASANVITLNPEKICTREESEYKFLDFVSVTVHEANHKWQHEVIENENFLSDVTPVQRELLELSNDIYESKDHYAYRLNLLERDSRAVEEYITDVMIGNLYPDDISKQKEMDRMMDSFYGTSSLTGSPSYSELLTKEFLLEIGFDIEYREETDTISTPNVLDALRDAKENSPDR